MAKNFLDEEERKAGLSYADGFRFGFGFFIANLLGLTVLGGVIAAVNFGLQQLR
jgi:hypothetical protein